MRPEMEEVAGCKSSCLQVGAFWFTPTREARMQRVMQACESQRAKILPSPMSTVGQTLTGSNRASPRSPPHRELRAASIWSFRAHPRRPSSSMRAGFSASAGMCRKDLPRPQIFLFIGTYSAPWASSMNISNREEIRNSAGGARRPVFRSSMQKTRSSAIPPARRCGSFYGKGNGLASAPARSCGAGACRCGHSADVRPNGSSWLEREVQKNAILVSLV
jgi:hypothetical protein